MTTRDEPASRDLELPRADDPDAIQAVGWPSRRMKQWPLEPDWVPEVPQKRIAMHGYQKVVGAVQAMFTDAALGETLVGLQDYCFQQGGVSNANPRDRAFFFDVLTHDLVFFRGDKGRPLIEDLPLDPKIYDALPHMRASFFDLYRVESRGIAGGAQVMSLLRGVRLKVGVRPLRGPRKGEVFLGRSVQIGRSAFIDDPILSVRDEWVEAIQGRFEEELEVTAVKHPQLTPHSLLKVAGYHLYEQIAALALIDELEGLIGNTLGLRPMIVRYRPRRSRELPDLGKLDGARIAERDVAGRPSTVLVDLAPEAVVHRSVREAMISVEEREVIVVAFIEQGAEALCARVEALMPRGVEARRERMTLDGVYRALRHVLSR